VKDDRKEYGRGSADRARLAIQYCTATSREKWQAEVSDTLRF
jgi:hypothetical protein